MPLHTSSGPSDLTRTTSTQNRTARYWRMVHACMKKICVHSNKRNHTSSSVFASPTPQEPRTYSVLPAPNEHIHPADKASTPTISTTARKEQKTAIGRTCTTLGHAFARSQQTSCNVASSSRLPAASASGRELPVRSRSAANAQHWGKRTIIACSRLDSSHPASAHSIQNVALPSLHSRCTLRYHTPQGPGGGQLQRERRGVIGCRYKRVRELWDHGLQITCNES